MAMDMFAQHNVAIKIGLELGSGEAIKPGVMVGLGLSVLPLDNLPLKLAAGRILGQKKLPRVARTFLDFILKEGASVMRNVEGNMKALPTNA